MMHLDDVITEAMAYAVRRAPRLIWLSLARKLACQSANAMAAMRAPFEHSIVWWASGATDATGQERARAARFEQLRSGEYEVRLRPRISVSPPRAWGPSE